MMACIIAIGLDFVHSLPLWQKGLMVCNLLVPYDIGKAQQDGICPMSSKHKRIKKLFAISMLLSPLSDNV